MARRKPPPKTCGDYGGRKADGEPCTRKTGRLCKTHLEGEPGGRPTEYTPERAEEILSRLAGGELLTHLCRDDHLPSYQTVARWAYAADEDLPRGVPPSFRDAYARARELQALHLAEEALEVADHTLDDSIVKTTRQGEEYEAADHEWIQRSRLRVETRMRLAALLDPKRLAERRKVDKTVKREETQRLVITEIRVESPSRDGKPAEPSENGRPEAAPRLELVDGKGARSA